MYAKCMTFESTQEKQNHILFKIVINVQLCCDQNWAQKEKREPKRRKRKTYNISLKIHYFQPNKSCLNAALSDWYNLSVKPLIQSENIKWILNMNQIWKEIESFRFTFLFFLRKFVSALITRSSVRWDCVWFLSLSLFFHNIVAVNLFWIRNEAYGSLQISPRVSVFHSFWLTLFLLVVLVFFILFTEVFSFKLIWLKNYYCFIRNTIFWLCFCLLLVLRLPWKRTVLFFSCSTTSTSVQFLLCANVYYTFIECEMVERLVMVVLLIFGSVWIYFHSSILTAEEKLVLKA